MNVREQSKMDDGLKGWTDYPEPDVFYSRRAMRQVVAIRYDGNKYLLLSTGETIKAGYLYRSRRRVAFKYHTLERRLPVGWLYEATP